MDICIISTGDELTEPSKPLKSGKIYDSNSTMLVTLLHQHGFNKVTSIVVEDRYVSRCVYGCFCFSEWSTIELNWDFFPPYDIVNWKKATIPNS